MTDADKKLKKYAKAVERRLNLPAKVKARVMSDFITSLEARRETGKTPEKLIQELGSPKKAAAELNAQMEEYTYRKSPWRYLFAACAVYGGVKILGALWGYLMFLLFRAQLSLTQSEAASIGVIGGADGPTAVFITTPGWVSWILPVALFIMGAWGFRCLSRLKPRKEG